MPKNSVKKKFVNTPKSAIARAETNREAQEAALKSLVLPFTNIVDIPKIERARGYQLTTTTQKFETALAEVNVPALERLSKEMRSKSFVEAISYAIRALILKKQERYMMRKEAVKRDQEKQFRAAAELTEQEREDDPNRFLILANKQALARIDELLAKCTVINEAFFLNDERHKAFREVHFGTSGPQAFQVFIERRLKNAYGVIQSISDSQIKESLAIMILSLASGYQSFDTKYINMALMGPPGIGKTTIGRQIALVLSQLLILLEGQCISITSGNLIAQYEGQTTLKTRSQLMAGLENVVLLDEAYALVKCSGEGAGSTGSGIARQGDSGYGQEAVNEMIDFMSNYLGQYCIIVAGYYDAMQCFFRSNEGFQRRFDATYRFKIEPFTLDKLAPLLEKMLPATLNKSEVSILVSLLPQMMKLGALKNSASDISALSDDIKSSIGLRGLLFEKKSDTAENALARALYVLRGLEFYLKSRNINIRVSTNNNKLEYTIE